jgi:hypothetical protein
MNSQNTAQSTSNLPSLTSKSYGSNVSIISSISKILAPIPPRQPPSEGHERRGSASWRNSNSTASLESNLSIRASPIDPQYNFKDFKYNSPAPATIQMVSENMESVYDSQSSNILSDQRNCTFPRRKRNVSGYNSTHEDDSFQVSTLPRSLGGNKAIQNEDSIIPNDIERTGLPSMTSFFSKTSIFHLSSQKNVSDINRLQIDSEKASQINELNRLSNITLDEIHIQNAVGTGFFATVHTCTINNEQSDKTYAIKVIRKSKLSNREDMSRLLSEKKVWKSISGHHPGIIKLYATLSDRENIYFLMDFARNEDMFSLVQRLKRLDEEQGKFYMASIISAIGYLHSKSIIYRDLKPEVFRFLQ